MKEVKYLGLIIVKEEIRMNSAKITAIANWEASICVKDVQSFLSFANFYQRFIKSFSQLADPLTALIWKDIKFEWSLTAEQTFQALKTAFSSALILIMFDLNKPSTVKSDSSDCVTEGVLSQPDSQRVLHSVTYFSTCMASAECNYDIYDKELLAIICAFKEWRPELEGAAEQVQVITDHKNLEYFMTTKQLSCRQARWSEFLSRFNFAIQYCSGKLNSWADALTRRSTDFPQDDQDPRYAHYQQLVIKPHNLFSALKKHLFLWPVTLESVAEERNAEKVTDQEELQELIVTAYTEDSVALKVIQALQTGAQRLKQFPLSECELWDNWVYYQNQLFVPENDKLCLKIL